MVPLTFTRGTLHDLQEYGRLQSLCFQKRIEESSLRKELLNDTVLCAKTPDNKMVGYVCFEITQRDENEKYLGDSHYVFYLSSIGVEPSFRKQGLAKELIYQTLLHAEKTAEKFPDLIVKADIHLENQASRRLLLSKGFHYAATVKSYYRSGKSAEIYIVKPAAASIVPLPL
jgi:ribosomal protein S18 acetylase RimI-like enzyme